MQQQSQQLLALAQQSAQQQQQILQQQQKLAQQQQHQSNIAALVGGGQGVAPDVIINGAGNCGRSSVPICNTNFSEPDGGSGTVNSITSRQIHSLNERSISPSATFAAQQLQQQLKSNSDSPSTSSENRHPLKKRLLDAIGRDPLESTSVNMALNGILNLNDNSTDCAATKIAKLVSFNFLCDLYIFFKIFFNKTQKT